MSTRNRRGNAHNMYQNFRKHKRVLCVCSAGLLRSPTTAWVLSNPPFNFNTRAAGCIDDFALVPVDEVLIEWAEAIVCMTDSHFDALRNKFPEIMAPIFVLNVPDHFSFRDPELIEIIKEKTLKCFPEVVNSG